MSRLLSSQTSKHNHKKFFCLRCLNSFTNREVLDRHIENCQSHETVKIKIPKKGTILEFKNYKHKIRLPLVVSADFEWFTSGLFKLWVEFWGREKIGLTNQV